MMSRDCVRELLCLPGARQGREKVRDGDESRVKGWRGQHPSRSPCCVFLPLSSTDKLSRAINYQHPPFSPRQSLAVLSVVCIS